jgi:NAD(P)-dependent dehydrogenase (short-subunit alcohol dehydrogenase family)
MNCPAVIGDLEMKIDLGGKRAFVSGSSAGIGKAIAIEFAKSGCDVAVHGRDRERAEETAHAVAAFGVRTSAALGDLATEAGCVNVAAETLAAFGTIDIVVNNAGLALCKSDPPWSEIPFQTWIDSYEVNFMSTLRMSQLFLPGMRAGGWGRFINISTGGATSTPVMTEYGAAKAALNKFTADMARDVGKYGATANVIAPGAIRTAALDEWIQRQAEQRGWTADEFERRYLTELRPQAVPKFGRPEDIAFLALFLASDFAQHISGAVIRVDGGGGKTVYM